MSFDEPCEGQFGADPRDRYKSVSVCINIKNSVFQYHREVQKGIFEWHRKVSLRNFESK